MTDNEECRYCGGTCPDEHIRDHACDGFLGDVDNLYGKVVTTYKIVQCYTEDGMNKRVNKWIKEGWKLRGELAAVMTSTAVCYNQVLVKEI